MKTLSRTISHIRAAEDPWEVIEPVSLGAKRLPIAKKFRRSWVVAWLIESHCYDRGDGTTHTDTSVTPVTAFGGPGDIWLLAPPDGELTAPDGSEVGFDDEAFEWFTQEIKRQST